jgi:hypothetical protein
MCISLRLRQTVFIAAAVLTLGFAPPASALVVKEMSGPTQSALAGKGSGVWKKADSRLRQLYGQFLQQGKSPLFTSDIPRVQLDNGKILINATAVSDGAQLFADLERLGLSRGAHYGAVVSGWIPLGKLEQAVALGSLRSISASLRPITNVGAVTSQGVAAMNATSLGFDGTGVTVGVLSDSYNLNTSAATNASQDIMNGDLPAGGVNVLEEEPSTQCAYGSCTDEGRAMLQIVHDVAPGASLAFHTAFNGDADFAQGILNLASAGAKVIVDDVTYFAEPMFQDGIIAQAVDTVKSQGVAYFSAAGNMARRSYESPFVGSGEHLYVQECILPGWCLSQQDVGELHNFASSGVDYYQSITIPDGAALTIVLNWDQPFASVSPGNGSQSDMDIWLMNSDGVIVASSKDDNIQSGNPIEILQYTPASGSGGTYRLMITHFAGPEPGLMKYINLSGYNVTVTNYTTNSSTNFGHSNAAGAEAVGAADYMYTPYWTCLIGSSLPCLSAAELSYFSSAGGTPILFDTSGNRLSSPVHRNKPGIVAPDGGNTTFFYPGSDYEGDGWPNFFGTSAAAPHAAGVAAVLKSANSALSPTQIYSALESTAANMTARCAIGSPGTSTVSCPSTTPITQTEGYNYDAGFGFIQADQAVAAVTGGSSPPPTCNLSLDKTSITLGDNATLSWTTTNATSLSIDQGIGSVALSGSTQVSPTSTGTTLYTGTVTGDGGTNTCSATLTVTQPPPPAALSLSLNPSSMSLSRRGQNSKTTVVTVNGPDSDTVTLSVSGLPSNVTPVWTGNPVTISSGSGTAQLQLVAGSRGPKGTFTVTVTGTDPSSNQANATLLLTITR